MIEKIYTIPINEAFEEKCGCPVCRLYARAREKALDYITGSAMMEPTVRIQSNEEGFCREHLADMLAMKTTLSLGLMLESRLDEVQKQVFRNAKGLFGKGYDGEKLAAYNDGRRLHKVSSKCSHLGCELVWNPDEKSWDCPCHGSRFSADGEVLNGPAQKRLE